MAAKGGGSWKVAYADFVTAMMAFFLVMWIGAQDQKVRQSVENYFVDPSGVDKKPARAGATFDTPTYGNLPSQEGSAMSRGRDSHTPPGEFSSATKVVADWLGTDAKARRYWEEQARTCREAAARLPEVRDRTVPLDQAAAARLAVELRTAVADGVTKMPGGAHQDLLLWSVSEVNWMQIAEDLLGR